MADNQKDTRFIVKIREQAFYIEIWIYNMLEGFDPLPVPFYMVEGLAIEESLMTWVTKGWMVLSNDFEIFERGALSINSGSYNKPQQKAPYTFRTDGRNKISIKIYPLITDPDNSSGLQTEELPHEQWEMSYDFVIYDIEDLDTGNASKKLRKLYFWDERYQILKERNLEFSTAKFANGGIGKTDLQKSIPATEAIKWIITSCASNSSDTVSVLKIGNKDGPSKLDNPNIPFDNINNTNWDLGATGKDGLIFYTSPANSCAYDDIEYISKYLKAKDDSPLFLRFDRYRKDWNLYPLSYYFNNAYNNQVERIVVTDNLEYEGNANQESSNQGKTPYLNRAPFDVNSSSTIQNFQSNIASRITNYKFSPMVAADDMRITNTPVHNFDFSGSSFTVSFNKNNVKSLLTKIQNLASGGSNVNQGLYSYSKSNQLLMNINTTKQTGLMSSNHFVPRVFFPKDAAAIHMIKDFIFLNEALNFTALGLTLRTPGKFLFVDREGSTHETNPFDDRFLGQWMIVKVVHLFTKETYVTDVVATKIYSYTRWWQEIDDSNKKGNY